LQGLQTVPTAQEDCDPQLLTEQRVGLQADPISQMDGSVDAQEVTETEGFEIMPVFIKARSTKLKVWHF
jgi:hypothetical protein